MARAASSVFTPILSWEAMAKANDLHLEVISDGCPDAENGRGGGYPPH